MEKHVPKRSDSIPSILVQRASKSFDSINENDEGVGVDDTELSDYGQIKGGRSVSSSGISVASSQYTLAGMDQHQKVSKRYRLAMFLEKFRRKRDALIRMSFFGKRIPFPMYAPFDGAFSIAELVILLIVVGVTVGFSVLGIVNDNPKQTR